jgi:hypothetical protein
MCGNPGPDFSAAYGAQAAEILLDAIARSDGTRASVTRELMFQSRPAARLSPGVRELLTDLEAHMRAVADEFDRSR